MPFGWYNGGSAQFGDTFGIVGGRERNEERGQFNSDRVWLYHPETDTWNVLDTKLSVARDQLSAFAVKSSAFPSCV